MMALFFMQCLIICSYALSCKSDTGIDVPFWVALKEPSGTGYVYYDQTAPTLSFSPHSMNDTSNGALAQTLAQLWNSDSSDIQYILYNDENPSDPDTDDMNGYNFTVGHTKAVWAFDSNGGFILQHSIPGFPLGPSQADTYKALPGSAWTYGQSVACINFDITELSAIAQVAILMIPNIYDNSVQSSTPTQIKELADGSYSENAVCNTVPVTSTAFFIAKSAEWNNDLWAACISPYFKTSLAVETWIHGEPVGPTCSNEYETLDIGELSYPIIGKFSEYYDHSKWAISLDNTIGLVCLGDINRMTSQFLRGGGAFCLYDEGLWTELNAAISKTNSCAS